MKRFGSASTTQEHESIKRMNAGTFIGRTITGIEPPATENDWQWLLRLDDGTAVEFGVRGYDAEEVTVVHLTDEVIERRHRDAERDRLAVEENRRRRAEANKRKAAHIAQMRTELDSEAFEKWRRETYPTVSETLKDAWTRPLVAEQFQEQ